ncbi:peptide MFS transporter [Luteimonas sp. RD2P54]|uniref:Peptide MFS transporter n=1 Tax=Luteimonas endophytica TaxID=3042023 RepID=A0ABT6J887_9GAMM|nr:peptide MFS transporter [Luteimonas endophytica]MDH5823036.1 peptide MFS transporter [Luteimonas endophytica]
MNQTVAAQGKHPAGLYTLFFLEMWERFSYYGMRAILFLFMVAAVETGGLGFSEEYAGAVYGLYTAGVYLLAVPGGWIADRLIGQQKAVWYGGIVIALGHFSLAVPDMHFFYLGLFLIVVGTGLLKPNASTIVGELYPDGGARRDAGFSLFYMGINLGAFIGPLIVGGLGEGANWHYGFAAAGVGMVLGVIQYQLQRHKLGDAGRLPTRDVADPADAGRLRNEWRGFWIAVGALVLAAAAVLFGLVGFDPVLVARGAAAAIIGVAVVYFAYILMFGRIDAQDRRRVWLLVILYVFSAMFWSGFEQAGSSLNIFAERYTDRWILGWEMPASWLQSVNPIFIILLAPVFASIWIRLGARNLNPSVPVKFGLGLISLGLGFAVMAFAASLAVSGDRVLPLWLVLTYLLHTTGELCLSPVGLSAVTKLAPRKFLGQMMGLWFISISLGNLFAGLIAGQFDRESLPQMPSMFLSIFLWTAGPGVLLLLLSRWLKGMSGGRT